MVISGRGCGTRIRIALCAVRCIDDTGENSTCALLGDDAGVILSAHSIETPPKGGAPLSGMLGTGW